MMGMNGPIAKLEFMASEHDHAALYAEEDRRRDGGATVRYHQNMARRLREIVVLLNGEMPKPFEFKGKVYVRMPDRSIVRMV